MKKSLSILIAAFLLLQCTACTNNTTEQNSALQSLSVPAMVTENSSKEVATESVESVLGNTESSASEVTVSPKPEDTSFEIDMTFSGDMILASYLNQSLGGTFDEYAQKYEPEYFLKKVRHIFEADDFTVVNLENVFSDNKNLTPRDKGDDTAFWFKAQTKNLKILTTASVEGVSLENNHTRDYSQAGYTDTVNAVTNVGLQYGDSSKIMYFQKRGFKIAVVCVGIWGSYSTPAAISLLNKAKENSNYQIIFFHGGTEKLHKPEEWKKNAARKLVDNGADLVIGSHPHVLQPREVYNGVEIVYSLGNFCFGGNRAPENRTILYQMKLKIGGDLQVTESVSKIIPCYVYTGSRNNFQPTPITDEAHIKKVLDFMDQKTTSPI